jgi:hypothetical protein
MASPQQSMAAYKTLAETKKIDYDFINKLFVAHARLAPPREGANHLLRSLQTPRLQTLRFTWFKSQACHHRFHV